MYYIIKRLVRNLLLLRESCVLKFKIGNFKRKKNKILNSPAFNKLCGKNT